MVKWHLGVKTWGKTDSETRWLLLTCHFNDLLFLYNSCEDVAWNLISNLRAYSSLSFLCCQSCLFFLKIHAANKGALIQIIRFEVVMLKYRFYAFAHLNCVNYGHFSLYEYQLVRLGLHFAIFHRVTLFHHFYCYSSAWGALA